MIKGTLKIIGALIVVGATAYMDLKMGILTGGECCILGFVAGFMLRSAGQDILEEK